MEDKNSSKKESKIFKWEKIEKKSKVGEGTKIQSNILQNCERKISAPSPKNCLPTLYLPSQLRFLIGGVRVIGQNFMKPRATTT